MGHMTDCHAMIRPMPGVPKSETSEERTALSERVGRHLSWVVELIYVARPELNQTKLAKMFNADQSTWNKYLRGTRLPSVSSMVRFCEEFGVSLDYLYRGRLDHTMRPELVIHLLHRHPELGAGVPLPEWASRAGEKLPTAVEP